MAIKQNKADIIFSSLILILTVILIILPSEFSASKRQAEGVLYEKGVILNTDDSQLEHYSIVTTGVQKVELKVLSGQFKGDTLEATNVLLGEKRLDKVFEKGDKVLTVLKLNDARDKCVSARASEYYRNGVELILCLCFALFLILFAKMTGVKAVLSFIFTALAFWKILLPAFLKGISPLPISIAIIFLVSTVIILLVGGINKKGLVALSGTFAGVTVTALMALAFGYFFKIPGAVQEYAETLLYTGYVNLNLSSIFISTIFISAAGAVMDVSMDVSAAQNELILKKPDMHPKELMISGFHIAAPILGSMTTTLLFAYSGSFMFAFMAFMAKGVPMVSIVNTNYIAAQILQTMVGSFGLVLVAPFTAIIGSFIYAHK
ncbi:MAG: YibE/F family protein [Bacteroidales bacterium]